MYTSRGTDQPVLFCQARARLLSGHTQDLLGIGVSVFFKHSRSQAPLSHHSGQGQLIIWVKVESLKK